MRTAVARETHPPHPPALDGCDKSKAGHCSATGPCCSCIVAINVDSGPPRVRYALPMAHAAPRFLYPCSCRPKRQNEKWILGFAAESIGPTSRRTEVQILRQWSDAAAGHTLSVHFCCEQHKRSYVRILLFNRPDYAKRSNTRTNVQARRGRARDPSRSEAVLAQVPANRQGPGAKSRRPGKGGWMLTDSSNPQIEYAHG